MNEFEKYQVQHLFLLIGENPLPNYIAAKTLLKPGGTIHLIYTSHTRSQAERLRDRCEDLEYISELISIEGYEADSYYIQKEVRESVKLLPQTSIGLHYTGGTKAMAVHAYRALIQARPDAIFSYLDPRRLEMCIDRKDGTRFHAKVPISLTLAEIFELHQLSLKKPAATAPKLPGAAITLAQLHSDQALAKEWRNWCNQELRAKTRDKKENYLSQNKLKQISLDLGSLSSEIKEVLRRFSVEESINLGALSLESLESMEAFCRWLDGTWLEQYTLQQIQTIREKYDIGDSSTSFLIEDPKNPSNTFFEFDVAFTRGYQLYALSCTTDDSKDLCKRKLFEAYLRAKQLGGDEARVALVCCSDKPDLLKSRLEIMLENPQIAVFGRQHLINLADHLAAWIIKNDREAQ
ncbi:MAG: DUF1887 family CARF protein [Leptolyngbya sp. Prado105]|jgi:hypothetical protein|nr:DUF1887 family CARF protein [Leptolyngbya sp. Prado105]